MCCGVRSDARLVEQLWCQCLCERFDLAGELALLDGQLQHPACDRAEREQAAAQLRVVSATGSGCREPLHEARTGEGPQLAAQRLRRGDQEIPELAERGRHVRGAWPTKSRETSEPPSAFLGRPQRLRLLGRGRRT